MGMTVRTGGERAEINMTPMIDVLLVLIIIFMVITPIAPRGLEALVPQQPRTGPEPVAPTQDIVVTVRSDGTNLLNREPLDSAGLQARLTRLYAAGATRVIFVRGDKDIEFRRVAEVIDMARGAGASRVALMTN
jgi:biopolymer transport protein TolR